MNRSHDEGVQNPLTSNQSPTQPKPTQPNPSQPNRLLSIPCCLSTSRCSPLISVRWYATDHRFSNRVAGKNSNAAKNMTVQSVSPVEQDSSYTGSKKPNHVCRCCCALAAPPFTGHGWRTKSSRLRKPLCETRRRGERVEKKKGRRKKERRWAEASTASG